MTTRRKPTTGKPKSADRPSHRYRLGHRVATLGLPRHGSLYIGLGAGVAVFLLSLWLMPAFAIPFGAIAMFLVYLALMFAILPVLTPAFLATRAASTDSPTVLIFAAVLGVVGTCCVTLFAALNGRGTLPYAEMALSIVSVLLGWFVVHTMAAMHYAYEYYEARPDGAAGPSGGLDFPDEGGPDGLAFLYFAYVVGVAFAVSDIRVTSSKMRRMVLIHSTFSYFFNTLIVAATVNVAVAVGGS